MSFKEFKNDLLMAIAVVSKAQPTFQEEALVIAKARNLDFRDGWLRQAVKSLDEYGLIRASFYLGGGEDLGMPVSITGAGLEQAEEIADSNGYDLYDEIAELENNSKSETTSVPASDRVVRIDHNSHEYTKAISEIDEVTAAAKSSNSLAANAGEELGQKLAEIDAGKILLQAPQANTGLVGKLILPALKWISEKIADNVIATLVSALMAFLIAWLGL